VRRPTWAIITVSLMAMAWFDPAVAFEGFHWSSTARCGPAWEIVSSPDPGAGTDELLGVTALSSDDAWAVGTFGPKIGGKTRTLTEHWDGQAWSVVPSPNLGHRDELVAVYAVSSDDVWSVGSSVDDIGSVRQLTEHWNGARWSISAPPVPESVPAFLTGVAARSAGDVWAVGEYSDHRTLVNHWNGSVWKMVKSPSPGDPDNDLFGASAISKNDAWAVGDFDRLDQSPQTKTLAEHWNGLRWTKVASPNPDPLSNGLYGVDAVSSTDVWAVGSEGGVDSHTLIERWDGATWAVVEGANVKDAGNNLRGVVAVGSGDVWAVGFWQDLTSGNEHTLAEHWDGARWSLSETVDSGRANNTLTAVSAAGGTVWAVGRRFDGGLNPIRTLVERICP
jgi:hypothetical protein